MTNALETRQAPEAIPSAPPVAEEVGRFFWDIDADLRITYLSGCFERTFGMAPDQTMGMPFRELACALGVRSAECEALSRDMMRREVLRRRRSPARGQSLGQIILDIDADPRLDETGAFTGYRGACGVCRPGAASAPAWGMAEAPAGFHDARPDSRHTLQRLRDFVTACADFVWETDAEHRFTYFSEGMETLFGEDRRHYIGRSRTELIQSTDSAALSAHLVALENHNPFHDFRYWRRKMNGDLVCCSVSGLPYRDALGHFAGYRGGARDVTQTELTRRALESELGDAMREREKAVSASAAKSAFLADLNHEIRNPLNGMIGVAALLRRGGPLSEKQERYLDMIASSGRDILGLLEPLSDISALETGEIALNLQPVGLRSLCADQVEAIRPEVEGRGVALSLAIGPGVPDWVRTDPLRLGQVIANLLGNAAKFTEQGAIEFSIDGTQPGWLRFSVADTGPGVPAAERRAIFRRHHRVRLDEASQKPGSGLGLAICTRIVERFGGWLDLTENPGGGSNFWFEIPLEETAPAPAA